jgi:thioredoxin 1
MVPMTAKNISEADFERTILDNDIVLVDFWADWCGPCRMFAPIYEEASKRHPDIVFAKVDTEAERSFATGAGITSIPTLMGFREGVLVFSQPGALPASALEQVIEGITAWTWARSASGWTGSARCSTCPPRSSRRPSRPPTRRGQRSSTAASRASTTPASSAPPATGA